MKILKEEGRSHILYILTPEMYQYFTGILYYAVLSSILYWVLLVYLHTYIYVIRDSQIYKKCCNGVVV